MTPLEHSLITAKTLHCDNVIGTVTPRESTMPTEQNSEPFDPKVLEAMMDKTDEMLKQLNRDLDADLEEINRKRQLLANTERAFELMRDPTKWEKKDDRTE